MSKCRTDLSSKRRLSKALRKRNVFAAIEQAIHIFNEDENEAHTNKKEKLTLLCKKAIIEATAEEKTRKAEKYSYLLRQLDPTFTEDGFKQQLINLAKTCVSEFIEHDKFSKATQYCHFLNKTCPQESIKDFFGNVQAICIDKIRIGFEKGNYSKLRSLSNFLQFLNPQFSFLRPIIEAYESLSKGHYDAALALAQKAAEKNAACKPLREKIATYSIDILLESLDRFADRNMRPPKGCIAPPNSPCRSPRGKMSESFRRHL